MDYIAIDGDIAEFVETHLLVSPTFNVSELRAFLAAEGHSQEAVHDALERWWDTYFVTKSDGATLTRDGKEFLARLGRRG